MSIKLCEHFCNNKTCQSKSKYNKPHLLLTISSICYWWYML